MSSIKNGKSAPQERGLTGIPALDRNWTAGELREIEAIPVERGSGNVFVDMGYEDAALHQLKVGLVDRIAELMKGKGLTQAALGKLVGLDQSKVSKLLRGQVREFSVDRLLEILNRLGHDVEIHIGKKERRAGAAVMRVATP